MCRMRFAIVSFRRRLPMSPNLICGPEASTSVSPDELVSTLRTPPLNEPGGDRRERGRCELAVAERKRLADGDLDALRRQPQPRQRAATWIVDLAHDAPERRDDPARAPCRTSSTGALGTNGHPQRARERARDVNRHDVGNRGDLAIDFGPADAEQAPAELGSESVPHLGLDSRRPALDRDRAHGEDGGLAGDHVGAEAEEDERGTKRGRPSAARGADAPSGRAGCSLGC